MKTVHEFFTNSRMEDSQFEYSWFHSWMVPFVRVESLPLTLRSRGASRRARMAESERQAEGLFGLLLTHLTQLFANGA
ncbi:MAG: hypothetical protein HXY38_09020 [Chloroflexi bacterium]|nr:hypothetical protein [Chloroflexota bacterium]